MSRLFKSAKVTSAFLKMGITGFAGSGKTKTSSNVIIGLVKMMRELKLPGADKPVYFLDTETGVDWVKSDFDNAGIGLEVAKTRSFADLLVAIPEARDNGSALIADSATHFWKELCETYQRTKAKERKIPSYRLQFQDWAFLKAEWGKFTDMFVNSPLHIALAGRAAFEYDYFQDDDGKKQLEKTDVRMAAEKDMGYEPSLLVLMERHRDMSTMQAYRTATVLKDRGDLIDGKTFRNPKFEDFLPHIKLLNLGGEHLGVDTTRNSGSMIPGDIRDYNPVQRRIVIDEIQTLLTLHYPSTGAEDKKKKLKALLQYMNATWTEIEEVMPLFDLRAGYDAMYRGIEGKPSKYATSVAEATEDKPEINDSLPGDCAPPAKAVSLKDRLMSDIPTLKTPADCVQWGLAMGDTTEQLSKADQDEISLALFAQQKRLTLNGHAQHA